jgi:zinc protease
LSGGWGRTTFSGKSLAEDFDTLIDVLADVVRQPTFPSAPVERLRGEIITGLQYRSQDTRYRASRAFYEAVYPPEHPYHYSARGTVETVSRIAPDDLIAFHRQHYGARGLIIAVAGAVKAAEALETIRARLGDWHNPAQPADMEYPPIPPVAETRRSVVRLPGKTQADLVIGAAGPSRFDSDYYAAVLANSILGQFGMMGRIGKIVREELGLAYYAHSQVEGGSGRGPWNVNAGVNPANLEQAIEQITGEIRRITREPVSDDDLADNQAYFTGRLPLQLESNEGIAYTLLNMETFDLGLDFLTTYHDRIYRLTKDDLLETAQRYLNPDALVIGIAQPA